MDNVGRVNCGKRHYKNNAATLSNAVSCWCTLHHRRKTWGSGLNTRRQCSGETFNQKSSKSHIQRIRGFFTRMRYINLHLTLTFDIWHKPISCLTDSRKFGTGDIRCTKKAIASVLRRNYEQESQLSLTNRATLESSSFIIHALVSRPTCQSLSVIMYQICNASGRNIQGNDAKLPTKVTSKVTTSSEMTQRVDTTFIISY